MSETPCGRFVGGSIDGAPEFCDRCGCHASTHADLLPPAPVPSADDVASGFPREAAGPVPAATAEGRLRASIVFLRENESVFNLKLVADLDWLLTEVAGLRFIHAKSLDAAVESRTADLRARLTAAESRAREAEQLREHEFTLRIHERDTLRAERDAAAQEAEEVRRADAVFAHIKEHLVDDLKDLWSGNLFQWATMPEMMREAAHKSTVEGLDRIIGQLESKEASVLIRQQMSLRADLAAARATVEGLRWQIAVVAAAWSDSTSSDKEFNWMRDEIEALIKAAAPSDPQE